MGKVKDFATGLPIGDVQLTLEPGAYSGISDEEGNYIIKDIPEGTYALKASKDTYYEKTVDGLVITNWQITTVNVELLPTGSATTTIPTPTPR